jgi:hypothetical protein
MAEEKKAEKVVETKEAPATAPAPTEAPKKKSNTGLIVVIIVLVIFVGLPILSVGAFWFFVGSKVNQVTKEINNGQVNIKTSEGSVNINTNSNQAWPASAPSVVPKFTVGKITSSSKFGDVWTVGVSGVSAAQLADYKAKLVAAGWTIDGEVNYGNTTTWTAKSGVYTITAALTSDDKNLIIGITKDTSTN